MQTFRTNSSMHIWSLLIFLFILYILGNFSLTFVHTHTRRYKWWIFWHGFITLLPKPLLMYYNFELFEPGRWLLYTSTILLSRLYHPYLITCVMNFCYCFTRFGFWTFHIWTNPSFTYVITINQCRCLTECFLSVSLSFWIRARVISMTFLQAYFWI